MPNGSQLTVADHALLSPIGGAEPQWFTTFDEGARSWAGVHGGVVVGAMLRAATETAGTSPVAVTAHLHSPVAPGLAQIGVLTQRAGRTVASLQAGLRQESVRATAQVILAADAAVRTPTAWPWRTPPPEELATDPAGLPRLELPADVVPFGRHLDVRPVGTARPFAGGPLPELRAWLRLVDPLPYEPAVGAVLLDALFPSLYATRRDTVPIPTVEFSAHFLSGADVPEWLLVEQRTTWATDDLCVDEAQLWTPDGRPIAQSRQLRRILAGPGAGATR